VISSFRSPVCLVHDSRRTRNKAGDSGVPECQTRLDIVFSIITLFLSPPISFHLSPLSFSFPLSPPFPPLCFPLYPSKSGFGDCGRAISSLSRSRRARPKKWRTLGLKCGPMSSVMAALPNTGGVVCSMPQCGCAVTLLRRETR